MACWDGDPCVLSPVRTGRGGFSLPSRLLCAGLGCTRHPYVDACVDAAHPEPLDRVSGAAAGASYWIAFYPADTARSIVQTRVADPGASHGLADALRTVYRWVFRDLSVCVCLAFVYCTESATVALFASKRPHPRLSSLASQKCF